MGCGSAHTPPPLLMQSDVIKRNTGLRNLQGNVFVFQTPVVQVSVYSDLNKDGKRQQGEPPVTGATVTITDPSGAVVGSALTNSNGLVRGVMWCGVACAVRCGVVWRGLCGSV